MPYWRLSNFYFFYFALLGAVAPFMPLYLEYLGFTPARIGELLALPMLMRCLAPNLWGWLGDKTGRRLLIVRWGALLTLLGFSLIFIRQDYGWLVLVMLLHAFFWHAILPQLEVITFAHLKAQPERYSRIRLWGSIGFIVTVVLMGHLFERRDMGGYPLLVCLVMGGIWLASLLVPEASTDARAAIGAGLGSVLRQQAVLVFYLGVLLVQVSHGPYYSFLSIYLGELGYGRGMTGWLWSLGVLAEIVLFMWMPALLRRFSVRKVLITCLLLATLRWCCWAHWPIAYLGCWLFSCCMRLPLAVVMLPPCNLSNNGFRAAARARGRRSMYPCRVWARQRARSIRGTCGSRPAPLLLFPWRLRLRCWRPRCCILGWTGPAIFQGIPDDLSVHLPSKQPCAAYSVAEPRRGYCP